MNFRLDIHDAGELLARLGMKDVVRRGKGQMEGQVAWEGSPLSLGLRVSLSGAFNVNIENGQFLKAEPGLAKLLGVLSLQALPRRLVLDFRDVFSEGFAFDFFRGDVRIDQGVAYSNNLQMKGINAAVLMDGQADLGRETQDIRVVVVPEINAGTASLIAAAINPALGLGTFLAQVVLRRPLMEAATQEFHIDGTWLDPKIQRDARVGRRAASPTWCGQHQPGERITDESCQLCKWSRPPRMPGNLDGADALLTQAAAAAPSSPCCRSTSACWATRTPTSSLFASRSGTGRSSSSCPTLRVRWTCGSLAAPCH